MSTNSTPNTDADWFTREKDRLLVELKRKLEETGHDAVSGRGDR